VYIIVPIIQRDWCKFTESCDVDSEEICENGTIGWIIREPEDVEFVMFIMYLMIVNV